MGDGLDYLQAGGGRMWKRVKGHYRVRGILCAKDRMGDGEDLILWWRFESAQVTHLWNAKTKETVWLLHRYESSSPSTKEPHALCVEYSLGEKEIVQEREGLFVQVRQCDQTTRLCFQYLAIFSNENLPKNIQIVQNWTKNQINLKYIAKYFKYWSKWWNFAQIWSHWLARVCERVWSRRIGATIIIPVE